MSKSTIIASIQSLLDIAIFFENTSEIEFYKEQLELAKTEM